MAESDSDDDLVTYGTPLEPLEEDEIPTKKPRLLEDQVVTDKQGRRRFHGAFTGGFSAGFFNTVGSLEGWTPSSFKSSRSQKQEPSLWRPEDFMDEEDLSEFGIAPLVLKAKQDYTDEIRKKISTFVDAPTLGTYVLKDLLKPARETVGIKLLKKMGWKPGQGVGPRLSKHMKEVTAKIRQRNYGCQLPPGSQEDKDADSDSDSDWEDIQFAPNDYEPILGDAADNYFGIGYEGLDKRPVLSSNQSSKPNYQDKNKKVGFGSQAFGVGAFEEEDEDIYAKDDMSRYDFALGTDQSVKEPTVISTPEGVLEGFVLAIKRPVQKHYPLPVLPRDFKVRHRIRKSRFDQPPAEKESLIKKQKLNHEERGKLVGDELEKKREKQKELVELIADVKINTSRFKPFAANPEKQKRYENYLKLIQIGKKDSLVDLQPAFMTTWDKEKEKTEFEKAAALFKPLSGGMEDRFATASQPDDLSDPLAVIEKFRDENDDRRKAAKMKMFGPLTRTTEDWAPCQLVCKRFNIPEPRKGDLPTPQKKQKKSNFSLFDSLDYQNQNVQNEEIIKTPKIEKELEPASVLEPVSKDENLENIQDKTDLFKAIFLASDDEEEQMIEVEVENREIANENSYEESVINSKRNLSPPKGIFESLDLDLLSQRGRAMRKDEKSTEDKVNLLTKPKDGGSAGDLIYGPKIPEKIVKTNQMFLQESDDDLWVEKKVKAKKHKRKVKKEKKSHKSKHKSKKHKR